MVDTDSVAGSPRVSLPPLAVERRRIRCGEVTLDCAISGEEGRPLVVLLHGFPESWYSWRHQIPVLAERYRVVVPSLRGYGGSDRPASVASYEMQHLTGDVRGLIDALGYESAAIVGHDWGGAISWAFAIDHPDACRKLAVCNCPHPAIFATNVRSNPRQLLRSWYMLFFQIPRLPEWLLTRNDMAALERGFRGMVVRKDREVFSAEDIREIKRSFEPPGAATAAINYYRAQFRNRAAIGRYSMDTRIGCPTLLIWAEDDVALGKELTVGTGDLVDAPFSIRFIPDCSHWVQQERPEEVSQALIDFLQG